MLNRKIDTMTKLILFILTFEALAYFIPVQRKPTLFIQWSYIGAAIIISYVLFYFYIRIRNNIFFSKVNKYCSEKKYDFAIKLLDKAIIGQPGIYWLRMQRAIIYGISGKYDCFWAEFNLIYNHKPFCEKMTDLYLSTIVISDGIEFINNVSGKTRLEQIASNEEIEKQIHIPYLYIYKAIHEYNNNNMKNAIYYAELLCHEQSDFIIIFANFMLMKAYENLEETSINQI